MTIYILKWQSLGHTVLTFSEVVIRKMNNVLCPLGKKSFPKSTHTVQPLYEETINYDLVIYKENLSFLVKYWKH